MAAPAIAMTKEMNGTCSGEAPLVPPVDVVVAAELVLVLVLELEAVLLPVEVELVEVPGSCQWVSWTSSAKGVGEKMFTTSAGKVGYCPVAGLTVLHASAQGRWKFAAAEAGGVGAVKQTESVSETIAQASQN